MSFVITGFALVIAAVLVVALAHMRLARRFQTLNHNCSQLAAKIGAVDKALRQSERAAIVAEVAALDAVVGKVTKSMRSQFGTVHAKLAQLEALEVSRAKELATGTPGDDGERPSRDELRVRYLRPPLPPTAD